MPGTDHHPHRIDHRVRCKGLDRPAQHRFAAEQPVLLGDAAAEALPAAGGDDKGGDGHGARLAPQTALL